MFDSDMSDSNVGERKSKNGINHFWVVSNVIHDHLSKVNQVPVEIQGV